jgi:signal transduction histidine kinase
VVLILFGLCTWGGEGAGVSAVQADSRREDAAGEKSPSLFLDFEDGRMGIWRFPPGSFAEESLGVDLAGPQKNNRSKGVLHCFVRGRLVSGSATYVLRDNGVSPIRVTPRTRVAWCWRVSENQDTDGFWLCFSLRNTKTGVIESARFVTWIEHSHSVIKAYFDPSQVWIYHCESLYDYLWRRYDPSIVDSFIVEDVTLGASSSPHLEAWVDNIWIGEGEPPAAVNDVETVKTNTVPSSKLVGFSYGFLDGDWIPDRVDMYRDRAEILYNPHVKDVRAPSEGDSLGPAVRVKKVKPQTIDFNPQRIDGLATIADLNGDGRDDILIVFDDALGSRCFKGAAPHVPLREVPLEGSALFWEYEYSYGAAVSDIDLDGDLDVLQFNPYMRFHNFGGIRLIRNEGNWAFVDGTIDSRILSQGAFGCTFGDVNGDGYPDLFAGYRWYYNPGTVESVNHLYINDRYGRFIAAPDLLVLPGDAHVEGGVLADIDNDGDLDLYVVVSEVSGSRRPPRNLLFLNDGTGRFSDATDGCGTEGSGASQSALAEDFDNDGLVDLFVISGGRCVFYRNKGHARFEAVPEELTSAEPGIGGAAADVDADGDMDIAILGRDRSDPILIENTNGNGRNFLEVRLRGTSSGRAGIGAAVCLYDNGHIGDRNHLIGFREINPVRGFGQSVPAVAHFGLGSRTSADLEVVFPPVHGKKPVVVRERGIEGGTFLEVSEHRNALVRLISDAFARWRGAFENTLFRIPSWLFALVALVVIWSAGALIRTRVAPSIRNTVDVILMAVIVIAAVLAVYRSLAWGVSALLAAFLLTLFHGRVQELLRSSFQSRSWRESATEFLLEELSQAVHTEKKFAFLMEISLADDRQVLVPARSYNKEFKSLKKLVSTMRMVTPGDQRWRQAGAEMKTIQRILGELRKLGTDGREAAHFELSERTVELQHAIGRLNTLLRDYRATLRRMLSVSFTEEWQNLRREYEWVLAEHGVALAEVLPESVDVVRIHLKEGEFRHIFKNLFDNSLRAMGESHEKRIRMAASLDATHLTVQWTDTGPGVPRELAGRLFNEVVPSSSPEGKGEGCAITGQIMRRRHGVVRLEEQAAAGGATIVMKFLRVK